MSGKFEGFTPAEIRKVQSKIEPASKETVLKKQPPREPSTVLLTIKSLTNLPQYPASNIHQTMDTTVDSSMASLQNAFKNALEFNPSGVVEPLLNNDNENIQETNLNIVTSGKIPEDHIGEQKAMQFQGMSLKDYEAQNRMIKEQNKMKKEMLCKAIKAHTQRTTAETRKLKEIENELKNLESELVADVSLLRQHIETASIRYMNAQKYYLQIEQPFLKAKLELQQAREKKEMLAEHLNIIIHSHEKCKAQKLAELLAKVGVSTISIQSDDETADILFESNGNFNEE